MEIPILSFDKKYTTVKKIHKLFTSDKIDSNKIYQVLGTVDAVRRSGKKIIFVVLRSKNSIRNLQCTYVRRNDKDDYWDELDKKCSLGACFEICGKIIKLSTKQLYELVIDSFKCIGEIKSRDEYPFGGKNHLHLETLRTMPHLKCQTKVMSAIDLITSTAYRYFHKSMKTLKIKEIQPVILTSNECESGSHPFVATTLFSDSETGDFSNKISTIPQVGDSTNSIDTNTNSIDTNTNSIDTNTNSIDTNTNSIDTNTNSIDTNKDFFKKPVFLTVSSQLHGEAIAVMTKSSKYWMTKAFRAEKSSGLMHAAEFLMPEWEIITDKLEDNMMVAEYTIKNICQAVLKHHVFELEFLEEYRQKTIKRDYEDAIKKLDLSGEDFPSQKEKIEQIYKKKISQIPLIDRLKLYVSEPFVISTHEECIKRMLDDEKNGLVQFENLPCLDDDVSREHEHYITDVLYGGRPVFLRFFPKKVKAFYMPLIQTTNDEIERVNGYDLLMPYIGEIVGGSQRIDDEVDLCKRMDELNMNKDLLQWYIDIRKYGSVPHGGAGLGFGRLIMALTGMSSIRDTDQFPRAYGLEMRC